MLYSKKKSYDLMIISKNKINIGCVNTRDSDISIYFHTFVF